MNLTIRQQLHFIRRGGETQRFHTALTIQSDTVGHHSFGVAWMVWMLMESTPSMHLIMAALAHDLPEHHTGDIPGPAKRSMGIREQMHTEESILLTKAGMDFSLTSEENRVLKMADSMDGMIFCVRERGMGNQEIIPVYRNFEAYVKFHEPVMREYEIYCEIQHWWNEVNK